MRKHVVLGFFFAEGLQVIPFGPFGCADEATEWALSCSQDWDWWIAVPIVTHLEPSEQVPDDLLECPYCHQKTEHSVTPPEQEGMFALVQEVTCNSCGLAWWDRYLVEKRVLTEEVSSER